MLGPAVLKPLTRGQIQLPLFALRPVQRHAKAFDAFDFGGSRTTQPDRPAGTVDREQCYGRNDCDAAQNDEPSRSMAKRAIDVPQS